MPRKSSRKIAQEKNLKKARNAKDSKNEEEQKSHISPLNCLQFAFSIIINGLTFSSIRAFMLYNNIIPPSKSSYYRAIDLVIYEIVKLAQENMIFYRNNMKPDTVISFDGSWDHKRNGRYCIVDVIDQSQKKIIDFEVVQKSTNAHPSDYSGSSHNMEAHAIRNIVHRLKNDQRIIGYCHDNDSTVRKIMSTEWPIQEYLDPNHTVKSFERIFNSINKKSHNKLKGLHNHLLRFMHFLINLCCSPVQKVQHWRNAVNHYQGNHQYCFPHKKSNFSWEFSKDHEAIQYLNTLLVKTSFILERCYPAYSTQLNESYHAIKSHYLSKEIAWRKTAFARLCCSILSFNGLFGWQFILRQRLGLPDLHPYVMATLVNIEKDRICSLKARRSLEYQANERKRRKTQKRNEQSKDKSEYVGTPKLEDD